MRANGLKQMRPEAVWQPIVSVEIDDHDCHEVKLGHDGQNPNLKSAFYLHSADTDSRVEIRVWYHPPSKKKRKRSLVASASHALGDLLRKQEAETSM